MSDLVERLNVYGRSEFGQSVPGFMFVEAATEIARLQAELEQARNKTLDEAAGELERLDGFGEWCDAAQSIRALKSPKPPIL